MSPNHIREFEITDDIRKLGFSQIQVIGKNLVLKHKDIDSYIRCRFYKDDIIKTTETIRESLSDHDLDEKTIAEFTVLFPLSWIASIEAEVEKAKNVQAEERNQSVKVIDQIRQMKVANATISNDEWVSELKDRYQKLREVVDRNIPELWSGLEFELSVLRILNIQGCTLPFIGIILGPPSSTKTAAISLVRRWIHTYYSDNFTPAAFVSHSTAVASIEELTQIDMLPKIKDRLFLTPELSPMFSAKEEDLTKNLGIITRIADGQGLMTDSVVYGQRGYDGKFMFTWVGAAVDIPHKVYRLLGNLGAKLYFFRMSCNSKTEDDLVRQTKFDEIQSVLFDYLMWFEIGPDLIEDKSSRLFKMKWDKSKGDLEARKIIARSAILLSHLRCPAKTWGTENTQGSDYGYSVSHPEDPSRAATLLTNLAKGHALQEGRNFISRTDTRIVIRTALSTSQVERVSILSLLLANGGSLTTSQITGFSKISKPTALRTMAELNAIGLVNEDEIMVGYTHEKRIILRYEFDWFLSKEFAELSEEFKPVDYSKYLKDKNKQSEARKEKLPPYATDFSHQKDDTSMPHSYAASNQDQTSNTPIISPYSLSIRVASTTDTDTDNPNAEQSRGKTSETDLTDQDGIGLTTTTTNETPITDSGYIDEDMMVEDKSTMSMSKDYETYIARQKKLFEVIETTPTHAPTPAPITTTPISPTSNLDANAEPILPQYVHRMYRGSDLFVCDYCNRKDDRWAMAIHSHPEGTKPKKKRI